MLPEIIIDTTANLAEILAARIEDEGLRALESADDSPWPCRAARSLGRSFPVSPEGRSTGLAPSSSGRDERAVPATDPESNYGLARSLWLDPAKVPASRVHRMEADAADPGRRGGPLRRRFSRASSADRRVSTSCCSGLARTVTSARCFPDTRSCRRKINGSPPRRPLPSHLRAG